MTVDQNVEILRTMLDENGQNQSSDYEKAINNAIEAIYFKDEIAKLIKNYNRWLDRLISISTIIECRERSVTRATEKHYWIPYEIIEGANNLLICSKCGWTGFKKTILYDGENPYKYCCSCGAKMEGIKKIKI